jgi:hypothetical protein
MASFVNDDRGPENISGKRRAPESSEVGSGTSLPSFLSITFVAGLDAFGLSANLVLRLGTTL